MFGRVIDGMETVRAIEETEREARPPEPGTTLVKLVCLAYPTCAAEYVLVIQIVRETDNAVIHPVNQVEIVDCGELATVIAQLQSQLKCWMKYRWIGVSLTILHQRYTQWPLGGIWLSVLMQTNDDDEWADYPQDTLIDNPGQLLAVIDAFVGASTDCSLCSRPRERFINAANLHSRKKI